MKRIVLVSIVLLHTITILAQSSHFLRDEKGRHIVGRGFVVTTNASGGAGEVFFNRDDYRRMVRLGANYQVIRLELGKLSASWGRLDQNYLLKLDSLVEMAKHEGIHSIFKMTGYVRGFSWEEFWLNEQNQHETYAEAWKVIWERYKDDPFVTGYDLVNEPRKLEMDISYDDLTKKYLLPLYRKLIDEKDKYNPDKFGIIQSIFMNKGEAINGNQYAEIKTPINRENVVFAPHIYQEKRERLKPSLLRFQKEAALLDAPIFIGEWGFPTFQTTDSSMTGMRGQLNYMDFYIRTAELFDSLGYGTIKAWFSGNEGYQNFLPGGKSTWAIFSDEQAVGTVERKYITDVIARPYPWAIAGDLHSFKYNFALRTLDVYLTTDNTKGASRIFVGADRHYPDGFSVICNDDFVLCCNPLGNGGLEILKSTGTSNPADFIWDSSRQQLVILAWPENQKEMHLKIVPGIYN